MYARKVDVEIRERAQGAAGGRKVVKKGVRRRVFDSKEVPGCPRRSGTRKLMPRKGRSERGAHNLLENEAGNARTEGRDEYINVVRVQGVN